LAKDPELQDKYALEVSNRYTQLSENNTDDQTQKYEFLIQANSETSEKS
jgi:hypothetical protein